MISPRSAKSDPYRHVWDTQCIGELLALGADSHALPDHRERGGYVCALGWGPKSGRTRGMLTRKSSISEAGASPSFG